MQYEICEREAVASAVAKMCKSFDITYDEIMEMLKPFLGCRIGNNCSIKAYKNGKEIPLMLLFDEHIYTDIPKTEMSVKEIGITLSRHLKNTHLCIESDPESTTNLDAAYLLKDEFRKYKIVVSRKL